MPRPATVLVPVLRKKERERLTKAARKSRDPKIRDRCRAMLWSEEGMSTGQIADLLGVSRTTPHRWIKDYLRFGFQGLLPEKSPGRSRVVDEEIEAALRAALRKNPRDLGYKFTRWTVPTLVKHLYAVTHVRIHPETLRRSVKRLGYRYKRPKLSLKHKQDKKAVRKARKEQNTALKKPQWTLIDLPSSTKTNVNSISIPA